MYIYMREDFVDEFWGRILSNRDISLTGFAICKRMCVRMCTDMYTCANENVI
jgi:hypothetical protein